MRTLLTAALVAALPLAAANAEIITVEYEATLDVQLPAGWPEGVVLSGTYTFDSEATSQVVGHTATYPLLRHSITLNGTLFVGNMNELTITDNEPIVDPIVFADYYFALSNTTGSFYGFEIIRFGLGLARIHGGGGPLTSLDLPLTEGELAGFEGRTAAVEVAGGTLQILGSITRLEFRTFLAAACDGFATPFNVDIGLGKREQRVIPLRMEIVDEHGDPLGPDDITAPTVSVTYSTGVPGGELDELDDSPGNATPGNSFRWDAATERWAFNLSTRPYTAAGTYTVTAVAGDEEYVLSPPCTGTFVRQ